MIDSISKKIEGNISQGIEFFGINSTFSQWVLALALIIGVSIVALAAYYIGRFFILKITSKIAGNIRAAWVKSAFQFKVFHHIATLIPLFIIYICAPLLELTQLQYMDLVAFSIQRFIILYFIFKFTQITYAMLGAIEAHYRHLKLAQLYSIKSYIQVAKIVFACIAGIFIISTILNKSPAYFLAGISAMMAVILLVFKDSILGFVASIQLAANDMVRIGDWVEMPDYGADGNVVDISLNTIKIQNFDKTIVTIPSHALLSSGVKNWRGMSESGGRRIKRSIAIDVHSVKFCNKSMLERLSKLSIFKQKIEEMLNEYSDDHHKEIASLSFNETVPLTNLGLFRAYLGEYLSRHPKIHRNMTFLIRQLQDTGKGIPIELYIFTNDTDWIRYEGIQSSIFDHIYAILPLFELRAFQHVSGSLTSA